MPTFKYRPRISRKEKAKIIARDHMQTLPEYYAEMRTRRLFQHIFATMTARNIELYPQLNRMYGMRIERRNNDEQ
jgi:hypothetical protein